MQMFGQDWGSQFGAVCVREGERLDFNCDT